MTFQGNNYDLMLLPSDISMMKFVSKVTEPYNIKTLVSLNCKNKPIMSLLQRLQLWKHTSRVLSIKENVLTEQECAVVAVLLT